MNSRILATSLFGVALLCGCAAPIRPEIYQPLEEAKTLKLHGNVAGAAKDIQVAAAVPDQNDWEKKAVAQTRAYINHGPSDGDNPFFGPQNPISRSDAPPLTQNPNTGGIQPLVNERQP